MARAPDLKAALTHNASGKYGGHQVPVSLGGRFLSFYTGSDKRGRELGGNLQWEIKT